MNTELKFRENKGIKQVDLNSNELKTSHKKMVTSTADFYSEWAIEKCSIEKPKSKKFGNSAESTSVNAYQTTNYDQYY